MNETNHNGKHVRVVAIRDISERKKNELQLEQSKKDYESLVKYSPDGIFIHNYNGEIIFANPSSLKVELLKMEFSIFSTFIQ